MADSCQSAVDAAGEGRAHLAAGAKNQHIAVQSGHTTFEVAVRWFRQDLFELCRRVDAFRKFHPTRIVAKPDERFS